MRHAGQSPATLDFDVWQAQIVRYILSDKSLGYLPKIVGRGSTCDAADPNVSLLDESRQLIRLAQVFANLAL
jgi:hypothetical protein